jgi:hypothetical protein
MGKREKLLKKLLTIPKNFTFDELVTLMKGLGYSVENRGRSSGSAISFYNPELNDKILIHKPHPEKEVKRYILLMIIEKLRKNKMIRED